MALTTQDAWSMVASAERAGRVLMVGYGVRCSGIWQTVRRLLSEELLGKIRQVNLAICQYRRWFWESDSMPEDIEKTLREFAESIDIPVEIFADFGHGWRVNPDEMGGGTFVGTASHWVDLMLWLAGAGPVEVVAFTETAGLPVDCFVNVQARLDNGVLLSVTSADAVPQGINGVDRHIMIVGDEGVLTDDREGSIWIHREGNREELESDRPDSTVAAAFVSAVMEGGENPVPARGATYAVALTEAAYRSASEGSIVQIEYP